MKKAVLLVSLLLLTSLALSAQVKGYPAMCEKKAQLLLGIQLMPPPPVQ